MGSVASKSGLQRSFRPATRFVRPWFGTPGLGPIGRRTRELQAAEPCTIGTRACPVEFASPVRRVNRSQPPIRTAGSRMVIVVPTEALQEGSQ